MPPEASAVRSVTALLSRRGFLLAAGSVVACTQRASPFLGFAYVTKEAESSISVVDLAAFAKTGNIETPAPVASPMIHQGRQALLAVSPARGSLEWISLRKQAWEKSCQAGGIATSSRMDNDRDSVWMATTDPARLVRIGLGSFQIESSIKLPEAASEFAISSDGEQIAVAFSGGGLAIVASNTQSVNRVLAPEKRFGPLRFRSDGKVLIAADHTVQSLALFETVSGEKIVEMPVQMRARYFCAKQDGGQIFVTDGESGGVVILYPYTTEVGSTVLAGKSPGTMAVSSNPDLLLVANRQSNDVTILDIRTGKLLAVVAVGEDPSEIAITPDKQYALVLNRLSGDLAVIRLEPIPSRRGKVAPLFTIIPVGEQPNGLTVVSG
jgi:YVTN family beta-propeller protein